MLDIKLIRENPNYLVSGMAKRGIKIYSIDLENLLEWDSRNRELVGIIDNLITFRVDSSADIHILIRSGKNSDGLKKLIRNTNILIKELEKEQAEYRKKIKEFLEVLPNIPDDDVPF